LGDYFPCRITEAITFDIENYDYKSEYITELSNSIFVLCPSGNNPETFRHYEAMEAGAIPIFTRISPEFDFVGEIWVNYPGPIFDSWRDAINFLVEYINDLQYVENLRSLVTNWYGEFKEIIKDRVANIVNTGFSDFNNDEYKAYYFPSNNYLLYQNDNTI
jgi:hypothetical protein